MRPHRPAASRNVPNDSPTQTASGKAPKAGNRMSGPERRAQIVDAAIALFGRHGFKGTTTKSLAQASGVSEATIFKHFPTKNDLYAAAFDRRTGVGTEQLIAELQDYAERGEDERLLRTLIRAIFYGYEHDRDLHRMLLYAWLEQEAADNQQSGPTRCSAIRCSSFWTATSSAGRPKGSSSRKPPAWSWPS